MPADLRSYDVESCGAYCITQRYPKTKSGPFNQHAGILVKLNAKLMYTESITRCYIEFALIWLSLLDHWIDI
jgi:hypothetical protein